MRALRRSSQRQEGLACFIATLLFGFSAFAQNETPPNTTPADEAVESATDEVSEVERQPEGGADPGEDLAPETSEPSAELSPNIDEILVRGEAGGMLVKDDTVSVMTFDPGVLQVEGIRDIRDLSNFTPSLEIKSAFAASNPTIYIRGVGLDDFNANAASAVAIYQDGVYMQSPAGQLFQFYDVERVEVLRGPQGSLYRNASAGAILLRSKKPSEEFNTYLTSTYGNYELREFDGAIGGPIVPDFLSGRLSGTAGFRDGITKNRCAANADEPLPRRVKPPCNREGADGVRFVDPGIDDRTNNIDNFAARGQLLLNLPIGQTETEWLLNVHGGQNRSRAFQYQRRARSRSDGDDGDPFAGDYDIDGPENIDLWGANLETTWLFGGNHDYELRNLVAYEWHDLFRLENSDGDASQALETTYTDTSWQLSEQLELRGPILPSKLGDGDWTLGVFYLQEDLDVSNFYDRGRRFDLTQEYTQEMWNFAVYGHGEYRFQPGCEPVSCDFTLIAGLRYNWEHKSFDTEVEARSRGQVRDALAGKDDALWDDWSGELSLAWNYSEDSNVYFKYARGWKGGHFNGGAVSVFDIITGVDPEIVDSIEGGLRSSWFDHRLKLNLTGFYYDYLDLQVFITEQTELGYPIPKLANASDARVYGVELDLRTEPIDGLRISFNAAWVESEYEEFVVPFSERIVFSAPCKGCTRPDPSFVIIPREHDYTGNTLIASPNFSATGSIEYDIPLPGEIAGRGLGKLTPRFSFSWKDEMLYDPCGGRGIRCNFREGTFGQDDFWIFNAALTWTSENEMFTLTGWVRNFMDEHYKTQSLDRSRNLGIILDAYADPRTYGITATFAF